MIPMRKMVIINLDKVPKMVVKNVVKKVVKKSVVTRIANMQKARPSMIC